jgi:hypothetical protein
MRHGRSTPPCRFGEKHSNATLPIGHARSEVAVRAGAGRSGSPAVVEYARAIHDPRNSAKISEMTLWNENADMTDMKMTVASELRCVKSAWDYNSYFTRPRVDDHGLLLQAQLG